MTEKLPVIEILDLHKSYDKLDVLKGVDLVAHEGCVVSLIGASGSGKSTLLRCANLLENSQHGDVIFHGDKVMGRSRYRASSVRQTSASPDPKPAIHGVSAI